MRMDESSLQGTKAARLGLGFVDEPFQLARVVAQTQILRCGPRLAIGYDEMHGADDRVRDGCEPFTGAGLAHAVGTSQLFGGTPLDDRLDGSAHIIVRNFCSHRA